MEQIYRYSRKLAAILDVNARKKERSRCSNFFITYFIYWIIFIL